MTEKRYSLIFKGEIAKGSSVPEVKQRLQILFKTTAEKVDRMFSGQPVNLKHNLDVASAEKYQKALFQAGALCELRPQKQKSTPEEPRAGNSSETPETETSTTNTPDWEILPPGSLLSETKSNQYITPDTHHLDISPQQGYIVEPDQSPAPPPPDTSHLVLEPR